MNLISYKRSIAETTIVRIKKLPKKTLDLRDDTVQMSETYAMIQALNKLI
ncbi:hypothetical protein [Candidatus Enterovibrio altilux]|nr:hypothetical protein [Candidatus Enterovibrio luxaltus]